ncbi:MULTISPECIES: hypothetical protein [unclassified Bradyrhizobium]|uniref:hypothetical protein n=1 Tax=unclassified Bradyrhizobium TaxID=2631580 RepID=UPI0028E7A664|nr:MULTISPECIES: hypothetical protein [unclassified Bradyrhizobium]
MTDSQKVEPIRRRHHCVTASGGDRSRRWSLTPPLALRSFDAQGFRFLAHRQGSGRSISSA